MDNSEFEAFINPNEKGFETIVLQIGSHSIKFGYASQYQPFIIPNVIAYKIKRDDDFKNKIEDTYESYNEELKFELKLIEEEFMREIGKEERIYLAKNKHLKIAFNPYAKEKLPYYQMIQEKTIHSQVPKSNTNFKKLSQMMNGLNDDIIDNIFKWTDTKDMKEKDYLIGREALSIQNENEFEIRFPIQYGYLNTKFHESIVLNDLEKILSYCFFDILKLERQNLFNKDKDKDNDRDKEIQYDNQFDKNSVNSNQEKGFFSQNITNMNLILLVPDVFIKQHIKFLLNLLFKSFSFKNIFLDTEAIATSFGAALPLGCIVDIGSSKINVCCVDEGFIILESVIRRNYGGNELTSMLNLYFERNEKEKIIEKDRLLPSHLKINQSYYQRRIIEKLKEDIVELPNLNIPTTQFHPKPYKLWLHKPNENTDLYNINLYDEAILPSMIYFKTNIIKKMKRISSLTTAGFNNINTNLYDPEDVMEDIIESMLNEKKEENFNNEQPQQKQKIEFNFNELFDYLPLDEMIISSILSIHNPELRKKLANSIILTGGGSKLKNLVSYLEERLINKLSERDNQIERVDIINLSSFDNKILSWIGGSVISKLDSIKEMWISREKWFCDFTNENLKKEEEDDKEKEKEKFEEKDNLEKTNEKEKQKQKKKKERFIDAGLSLLRQKTPFIWSNSYMN